MNDLIIPPALLLQHLIVLGKTGSGKSSTLRHIVEWLLKHKKRVVIIDPKGDWHGLKWSADGKHEGFPIIGLGDFKDPKGTDVPINAHSGKQIGELICSGNRPCIIGMRGWMTSHMVRFWIDFASTLFAHNSGELYVIGDEFHNFAPKGKIMDPDAGKCLHWSNRLLSEGRGLGIVCLLASQRPQKVHNDTLTSCETLVAMRVIHASDRQAIADWIDGAGDPAKGKTVLNSLASMPRGQAYVWSPEAGFGPEVVKFPMFQTFDSFAPPQLMKQISAASWSSVDLDAIKQKLADVIEEQKANDPAELKRKVRDLEVKLRNAESDAGASNALPPPPVEVPVFDEECKALFNKVNTACEQVLHNCEARANQMVEIKAHLRMIGERARTPIIPYARMPMPAPVRKQLVQQPKATEPEQNQRDALGVSSTQQRILDALAWFESIGNTNPTNVQVGAVALLDATGGHFSNVVGPLSTNGLVTRGNGVISLTDAGRALAKVPETVPSLYGYHTMLCERIRKMRSASNKTVEMLEHIVDNGNKPMTAEQLGRAVSIDHTGGHFSNTIGPLGTIGLIDRRNGLITPTEILFPKGLS